MNQAMIADRWHAAVAALRRAGGPPPRLSRWAWAADVAIAVVLAVGTLRYALSTAHGTNMVIFPDVPTPPGGPVKVFSRDGGGPVDPWESILAVLTALPLVVRRRYPLAAFWAVIFATLLFHRDPFFNDAAILTFVSCLIAAYSAAMYSPYRAGAVASIVVGALLIAVRHDTSVPNVTAGWVPLLVLLTIGLGANTVHAWKQRLAALQAEQAEATHQAVRNERARIARELHDVVTHNVAVMVVQAGAARKVIDAAPDQAKEALLAVESGGRAAMAELRHVMGLLTTSMDDLQLADLAPQPGLEQLAALVDPVRDTGLPVELTVSGKPLPLTAGVDLTAYRVVQEALTNTLKHAAGSSVRIAVDYAADAVRIEVADSGGLPTAAADSGNGRGLVGLRERLAVYGGTLSAGALPGGGYRVRAVIPIEPS